MQLAAALAVAGIAPEAFKVQATAPRVHRVKQFRTTVNATFDPKCVIKTRTRKIAKDAIDLMDAIGAGRFNTPIPRTRRV